MKGQAEMMGLVLLVVMLVIGLVLYVQFSAPEPSFLKGYEDTQIGQAFVTSLVRSEVEVCGGGPRPVGTMLRYLAEGKSGPCTSPSQLGDVLENVFGSVASDFMGKRAYTYRLSFRTPSTEFFAVESDPPCTEDGDRLPAGSQPIPTEEGPTEVFLEICP